MALTSERAPSGGVAFALRRALSDFELDVTVEIAPRGVTALFGSSGSGKTTFLRLLAGLDRGRGTLDALGERWQDDARRIFVPPHERALGYVFQEASLFPHLDVRENLAYGQKRRPAHAPIGFDAVVAMLGIEPLLARTPERLSGGERQRVAIARALLAGPRLLLMDEPLASLDDARKSEVFPYLERLRTELSIPIVYVSHALDEVARLADDLVLLQRGRMLASGPVTTLLSRLDLPLALGEHAGVVIDATVAAHDTTDALSRLDFDGGSLWVSLVHRPIGSRARTRVLARDVSLALDRPGPSSILNIFPARVLELSDEGPDRVNVRLALGAGGVVLLARVTRRSRDALALGPGSAVYAQVKSVALVA